MKDGIGLLEVREGLLLVLRELVVVLRWFSSHDQGSIRYTLGMLRIIFWVVVAVLFLSFFGISVQGLIENPTTQTNFGFVLSLVEEGWNTLWGAISGAVTTVVNLILGLLPN